MLRSTIIDALYPPPPDPESAEDAKENKEPSSADENQKLLVDESKRPLRTPVLDDLYSQIASVCICRCKIYLGLSAIWDSARAKAGVRRRI